MFRCDIVDSDSDRWREIPAWMFDRSACAKVRLVATDPHADISALVAVCTENLIRVDDVTESLKLAE